VVSERMMSTVWADAMSKKEVLVNGDYSERSDECDHNRTNSVCGHVLRKNQLKAIALIGKIKEGKQEDDEGNILGLLGCATHLLSEQSVIGTSFLLLSLSRRIQLPSKLSWPVVRLFACHDPPPPPLA